MTSRQEAEIEEAEILGNKILDITAGVQHNVALCALITVYTIIAEANGCCRNNSIQALMAASQALLELENTSTTEVIH